MSGMDTITQTTGGKIALGAILVVAVAAVVFQVMHMNDGEKSRDVTSAQAISDAQRQIDAIKNNTTMSPEAKQAAIAHFQGNIDTASGKGAPKPPGGH